jgi:hypothetical protein
VNVGDPVASSIIPRLDRPGANITGFANYGADPVDAFRRAKKRTLANPRGAHGMRRRWTRRKIGAAVVCGEPSAWRAGIHSFRETGLSGALLRTMRNNGICTRSMQQSR